MAVSLIALAVASAGGATAASVLITGKQVKNGSLTGADIKDKSLTARDIKGAAGPKGAQGLQGIAGVTGPAGPQGVPGSSIFDGAVPTGKTIKGVWGGEFRAAAANHRIIGGVSFPIPVSVPLETGTVRFGVLGVNGLANATIQAATADARESAGCSGNFREPTAPAGVLCAYVREGAVDNVEANSGLVLQVDGTVGSGASKYGFQWSFQSAVAGATRLEGTWAYTAP